MKQLNANDDLAIAVSRQHIFNNPIYKKSQVYCFDRLENIADYSVSLFVRKTFDLLPKIEEIIQKLLEAGFIRKWESESQLRRKYEVDYIPPTALTFEYVAVSIYIVMFPGLTMCCVVFLVEYTANRKCKINNKSTKYWILLQRYCDGHRYFFVNFPETLSKQNRHRSLE